MIETQNLLVIPCDREISATALKGNDALEALLKVEVPENWTEFGNQAMQYALDKLKDSDEAGWWTYLPIHRENNTLIGSGGYKGKPSDEGIVEVGYEITTDYRNKGLATEFVSALLKNVLSDERVKFIIAHTLGEDNASTKVLRNTGFIKVSEINDPDDGLLWKWEFNGSLSL